MIPLTAGTICNGNSCTTGSGSAFPAAVEVFNTNGAVTAAAGSVTGGITTTGVPSQPYVVFYTGQGLTNNNYEATTPVATQQGPTIAVNNSATISWSNILAEAYTGAVFVSSYGAVGTGDGEHNKNVIPPAAYDGGTGGTVTIGHAGSLSLSNLVGIQQLGTVVAGLLGISGGGNGGSYDTKNACCVGSGGNGGPVSITTAAGSSIMFNGPWPSFPAAGIEALSLGGTPATVDFAGPGYLVGDGGNGGAVVVTHAGTIANTVGGAGIIAASSGGPGFTSSGTNTLAGGGGAVTVDLSTGGQIAVSGGSTRANIGVFAASTVGLVSADNALQGGGPVTIGLDIGSRITVSDASAFNIGVMAVSSGSASILQPFNASAAVSASGTATSGDVTVTNKGSIQASGASALGIAALSVGGAGIVTSSTAGLSYLGNSSSLTGYNAGGAAVMVKNDGVIATNGNSGHGILAASSGGGGILSTDVMPANSGGTWTSGVILGASTPAGSPGQNGGTVVVTNNGRITTGDSAGGGTVAFGIVAQSIGGGGGSFAGSGVAAFVGDNGGGGGAGGEVTVTNRGLIGTNDDGAIGILAQSIGGGGGNGANAAGAFVAVGGEGGSGGNGAQVSVSNAATGSISTIGDFAAGIIAQSIGGGGGNGGYAISAGAFISSAIGGTGGSGGAGGTVLATNLGTITTNGQNSLGIVAQSVGGGGGNGGAAHSYEVGIVFSVNLAVGGTGGEGGNGGVVAVNNINAITTNGPDAIGLVAQSIGGGGGTGGASVARTVAVSVPDVPTFSFTASVGGSGAKGGNGGDVVVRNAASISTKGDGGLGILAQSVGGGGGNGGDSTAATYAVAVEAGQTNVTLALGASGGSGGTGGGVTFGNGASLPGGASVSLPPQIPGDFFTSCTGCSSTIATSGANAAAITVQSIGGGGGNATAGNANNNTPLSNFGGDTYQFSLSLGASGGTGATGGAVTVGIDAKTTIVTTGSASAGIIAQSIGGGGGSSAGGSFGVSGALPGENNPDTYQGTISLGGNGVAGADGGAVTVTNAAKITTGRGDSIGILAQSIGGGGGLAGSSDAAATVSSVNQIENQAKPAEGVDYEAEIAIGGKGGAAGNGGAVGVTNSGAITTAGVRAYAIEAQSVGGGGGNGGSATSNAQGTNQETMSADVALGGSGGGGGNGGTIAVTNSGAIVTGGYNSAGILAQSIGGGGGVGADGSVAASSSLSLGAGLNGSSGASGNGGQVTVTTGSGGTILTQGDEAVGILAQSIGGGGGTGSFGCGTTCLPNGTAGTSYAGMSAIYALALGSLTGGGAGGTVSVTVGDRIATTGARAMGIVAQSIGGGGGLAPAAAQTAGPIVFFPAAIAAAASSGGSVAVTLEQAGNVVTTGAGAWGILAQSVGAGGGFAGDSSLNLRAPQNGVTTGEFLALGGQVEVLVNGNVVTTGVNAHGVVAQSVGGGGGFAGGGGQDPKGTVVGFGNTGSSGLLGVGGAVTVIQSSGSSIITRGTGSIGIYAQVVGSDISQQASVSVSGTVIGGTNNGYDFSNGGIGAAGIVLSSASPANSIVVRTGGSVGTMDGINGTAIMTEGSAAIIQNSGTITGSIDASGNTVTNMAGGLLKTGATINVAGVSNNGTVNVLGSGTVGKTTVTGSFTQGATGNLVVDVNPQTGKADLLQVSGTASLGGTVTPVPLNLMPGTVQVVNASGGITGSPTLPSSLLFGWNGSFGAGNTTYSVSSNANFSPGGVSLTASQQSLANNFASAWANADPSFASKFLYLSQINNPSVYAAVLNALSPKATQAQLSAVINNAGTMLGAAMSCPVFVEQSMLLGEDNCAWAKVTGSWTNQTASGDIQGYQVNGVTYRLGAQHGFAPDWYIGASFGLSQTWATMDGGSSSSGTFYDGSVSLKHTMGPWLFAGSLAVAGGTFRTNRVVGLPGGGGLAPVNATLQSDQSFFLAGGRLRAAYEVAFTNWYLRPYGDIDVIHTDTPGFQESGRTDFALNVQGNSQTSVAFSPMVELGGRIALGDVTLRPYLAAGARFLPDNKRWVDASLFGALPGTGTFRTYSELPAVLASVDLGLQLYRAGSFEARAEYSVKGASNYLSQAAAARIAYHF